MDRYRVFCYIKMGFNAGICDINGGSGPEIAAKVNPYIQN
jgi:hypothetical protein